MKTIKSIGLAMALVIVAMSTISCDPAAYADSGEKVTIDINVNRLSAGFTEIIYTPSSPAYFLACVDEVVPGIDVDDNAQAIMDLALDSCYVKYVEWRHTHLMKMEKDIADFPSHVLNYGKTTIIHNYLKPDTDYWVYCFVVDKNSNKANGRLFWTTIHTEKESIYKDIRFRYRVKGEWDYVYPYDSVTGEIVTNVPWGGMTVDSLKLRRFAIASPGTYFDYVLSQYNEESTNTFLGIYAHQNDGVGDGTSNTLFVDGHTYYTAMRILDGPFNESYDVYKFTWHGPDTEYVFDDSCSIDGEW